MKKVIDLAVIAMLTVIVFTVEQALAFIPNIQLTVLLFIIYTKIVGFKKTMVIILLHTLADNLYNGSLNPYIVLPMLIGWSMIPVLLSTVFRKFDSPIFMMVFAFLFGFIYGMIFIPFASYQFGINIWAYYLSDLPFEALMGVSGAISVGLFYTPLMTFLKEQPVLQKDSYLKKRYVSPTKSL